MISGTFSALVYSFHSIVEEYTSMNHALGLGSKYLTDRLLDESLRAYDS